MRRYISPRSPIATGPRTREWMAEARTPETRARICRWSRVETVGVFVTIPGPVGGAVASFASAVVIFWLAKESRS